MRYEGLLASRYIRAQKRQSVFTVISISTAIAVMAMIFVLYGVFMDCLRKTSYSHAPYHIALHGVTDEQAEFLRNEEHIESVTLTHQENSTSTAYIMFRKDIGDTDQWLQTVCKEMGVHDKLELKPTLNVILMRIDHISDGANLWRLRIFCIFFIFAVLFALALRLIVDTAFEISSKERERHYGVLQSIGATPQQIVKIITLEGMRLCLIAIPIGLGTGTLLAYVMFKALLSAGLSDVIDSIASGKFTPSFSVDPKMLAVSSLVGIIWVLLSAYGVGMRVIRKSPMEAITARTDDVKKVRKHTLSGKLFGISGSIASRNARRQKKRFVITVLTLTVSITMFAIFTSLTDTVERSILDCISQDTVGYSNDFTARIGNRLKGISAEAAAQELADSGLFKNIAVREGEELRMSDEAGDHIVYVQYVNREAYTQTFGDNPPVSYDELVRTGGYVLNPSAHSGVSNMEAGIVKVVSDRLIIPDNMKTADIKYIMNNCEPEKISHELSVIGSDSAGKEYDLFNFFGAMETYQTIEDEWFGENLFGCEAYFSYNSDEYNYAYNKKAEEWFDSHSDSVNLEENFYTDKCGIHCVISSIKSGALIFNVLIGLAALINLMNIISTGIANRRSELASLQCIGMTDKQLYRMTVIECMQFTVTAALLSAAICGAVILGTEHLLPQLMLNTYSEDSEATIEMMNELVRLDHTVPFIRIAIASVMAFAAGCITSFLMLRTQNKDSLSDQIRGTELKLDIKRAPNS